MRAIQGQRHGHHVDRVGQRWVPSPPLPRAGRPSAQYKSTSTALLVRTLVRLYGPQAVFDQTIAIIVPYDRVPICHAVRDAVAGVKEPGSCHGDVGPGARPDLGHRQHRRLHHGPPAGRVCTDVVHYERSRAPKLPVGPARQCRRPRGGLRARHSHIAPHLSEQRQARPRRGYEPCCAPTGGRGAGLGGRGRSAVDGGMWPRGEAGRAKFRWADWARVS